MQDIASNCWFNDLASQFFKVKKIIGDCKSLKYKLEVFTCPVYKGGKPLQQKAL
jgi:hypothetical protein